MDKSGRSSKSSHNSISNSNHGYSIPPPHAHSLINKRDSLLRNTEIKAQSNISCVSIEASTPEVPSLPVSNKIVDNSNISNEHEIKFTQVEGCTPSTCVCVFIAILLISIGASSGVYFGLRSYENSMLKERVFMGQFTVTRGDSYNPKFEKRLSEEFKEVAKLYKERLDRLFNESHLTKVFKRTEILALDKPSKPGSDDLVVHYNLIFSPKINANLNSANIYLILGEEILNQRKKIFKNVTIDPDSIKIQERKTEGVRDGLFYTSSSSFPASAYFLENSNPWKSRTRFPGLLKGLATEAIPPPRRCTSIDLKYCSILSYNHTSYPNVIGHWNVTSLEEDFITFRQVVDAECYSLAREFICRLLQPECENDEMIWPCKEFCQDFKNSCKDWIPTKIIKKISCDQFPSSNEKEEEESFFQDKLETNSRSELILYGTKNSKVKKRQCRVKPGCINELKIQGRAHQICDSVIDCKDESDEISCDYCTAGISKKALDESSKLFFCGNGQCIDQSKRCDSIIDCINGQDEVNCLHLFDDINYKMESLGVKNEMPYQSKGYLFGTFRGQHGKVCASTFLNMTISTLDKTQALKLVGVNICRYLGYRDLFRIDLQGDRSQSDLFIQINEIKLNSIISVPTTCSNRQIIYVSCGSLSCGLNPAYSPPEKKIEYFKKSNDWKDDIENNQEMTYRAFDGDWPWHSVLTKNSDYICDTTLIGNDWIILPSHCLNDYFFLSHSSHHFPLSTSNLKYQLTFGSIRLINKSPLYTIERKISAVIKSPFPEFNLTLVRFNKPVEASNYIRPICLDQNQIYHRKSFSNFECFTTYWDFKKDQLLFARAFLVDVNECTSADEVWNLTNYWCAKLTKILNDNKFSGSNRCPECGIPGRPLYCSISSNEPKWHLIGIEVQSDTTEIRQRQFLNKNVFRFVKISNAFRWISETINTFQ